MQSPNSSKNGSIFIGNNCAYSPKQRSMMYNKTQSLLEPPSILEPRGSSTPLHSSGIAFKKDTNGPPVRHYMSPSRYQLSRTPTNKSHTLQNSSGPLLATTKYNVNVGTYMDALSPGLSERIVQYNNETKTHQAKYGSPGKFPIVHFFKKDLPVLQPKPKKVTVRLASSYQNNEHNRLLMEGIMRENNHNKSMEPINDEQAINDTGTRSVLDALKEISRKRIHSSKSFEVGPDSYKRPRLDFSLSSSDNEESSTTIQSSHSSSSSKSKSLCVVDPITASLSSSFLLRRQLQKTTKRKKSNTEEAQVVDVHPKRLNNAETQTAAEVHKDTSKETPQKENKETKETNKEVVQKTPENTTIEETTPTKEPPVKKDINILDVSMLEANKKKKLSKMLGVFCNKDELNETPTTDSSPVITVTCDSEKNGPVSILSPMNKAKHTKHVTFNIPSDTDTVSTLASIVTTTSSLVTPISSPAVIESPKSNSQINEMSTPSTTPHTPNVPFKFGTPDDANDTPRNERVVEEKPSTPAPPVTTSIAFGGGFQNTQISTTPIVSSTAATTTTTASSSPPKIGGFKFDLNKPTVELAKEKEPNVTVSFANAPTFGGSLKTPEKSVEVANAASTTTFGSSSNSTGFGSGFVLTTASTSNSVDTPTTASGSFGTSKTTFGGSTIAFGTATTNSAFRSSTGSFASTTSLASSSTPTTTSVLSKSTPSFSFTSTFSKSPSLGTTNSSSPSTATSATAVISPFSKSTAFGGGSASSTPITNSSLFGSNTQQQVSNNITTPKSSSGVATTLPSLFGGNAFNDQKPSIFGGTNPALPFSSTSTSGNVPVFGAAPTKSDTPNTNSITFGTATPVMAFGSKDATPATTVQPQGMFSFATTSAPTFGVAKANTTSSFGNPNKSTTNGPFGTTFGSNQSLAFPPATTPMFGGATSRPSASLFGTTTTTTSGSVFGANPSVPTFGGSVPTTTTTPSLFGATTTAPVFGTTTTTIAPAFGTTTTTPLFGTTTTTTSASSMFGTPVTKSAINFSAGSNQGFKTTGSSGAGLFGQNTNNNQFGSAPFGSGTSTNNFGGGNSTFGATKPAPAFGGVQPPTCFGNTSMFATPNTFSGGTNNNATTNNAFGANSSGSSGTTSGVFSFGGEQPGKSTTPNVFAFGSTETPKPNFNFSSGGGGGFGNNPSPSFGTGSTSTFGSTSSFGSTQPPPPAFGSNTVPNFGANPNPAFGTGGTPQFNAPSPGMFSIGSGSTGTNRMRTQLKGRRRT